MIGGASLPIGPVGSASGNTTDGPYDVLTSIPEVSQSYYGSGAKSPGVIVQATDVTAQAQGSLSGTPYASASIAIGSVGVSLVPPVSKGGAAYLSVALTQAAGMSTYIPSGSAQGTAYGSTALGSVVVSGTLLPGADHRAGGCAREHHHFSERLFDNYGQCGNSCKARRVRPKLRHLAAGYRDGWSARYVLPTWLSTARRYRERFRQDKAFRSK